VTLTNYVRDHGPDTGPEKWVLWAIASRHKEKAPEEGAFVTISTLRKDTTLGERTIRRALRRLEAEGWLTTMKRKGRSSVYRVNPGHSGPPAAETPRPGTTPTPATQAPSPATVAGDPGHSGPHNKRDNKVRNKKSNKGAGSSLLDSQDVALDIPASPEGEQGVSASESPSRTYDMRITTDAPEARGRSGRGVFGQGSLEDVVERRAHAAEAASRLAADRAERNAAQESYAAKAASRLERVRNEGLSDEQALHLLEGLVL